MSQIFYVVRHGETDWNVLRKLQGHSDIALNAKGISQAESLQSRVQNLKIDRVISSDLMRAHQTAQQGFPNLPITTVNDLREVNLGEAEGLTQDQIVQKWGQKFWDQWASTHTDLIDTRFAQGESKREMLQRVINCFEYFLDTHPTLNLGFVSHGLVMRSFVHHINPKLSETHYIENCGVLKIKRTSNGLFEVLDYYDQSRSVT
jgi:probable phosphoglycerate mutase